MQEVQKTVIYLVFAVTILVVKILTRSLELKPITTNNVNKQKNKQTTSLGLQTPLTSLITPGWFDLSERVKRSDCIRRLLLNACLMNKQ